MKIAITTSVSGESATGLAKALVKALKATVHVIYPFKDGGHNFRQYDWVLGYGCSASTNHQPGRKLNKRQAILTCVNKFETFKAFARAGVPHPRHWGNRKDIPKGVASLVIRKGPECRKAEDLQYWDSWEGKPIPEAGFYSEWFDHQRELRITYVLGQVFVYRKDREGDLHIFNPVKSPVYVNVIKDAKKAAEEIGIDFCSFDVLYNDKNSYCFLEANSGSLLQEEVTETFIQFFKEKM